MTSSPWLITGLNGTLAPHVARVLGEQGQAVVAWGRHLTPPDDALAAGAFLAATRPQGIFHLAIGSEAWAAQLARHAADHGVPFVLTSTAMVFHHDPNGPHRPHDPRTSQEGYGQLKIRTEDAVQAANPRAVLARIGWQMDPGGQGNNMVAHLDAQHAEHGRIRASRHWIPACSLMADTARALVALAQEGASGPVHLDSNAHDALPFPEVVRRLAHTLNLSWEVEETEDYHHDQRLLDPVERLPRLSERLSLVR